MITHVIPVKDFVKKLEIELNRTSVNDLPEWVFTTDDLNAYKFSIVLRYCNFLSQTPTEEMFDKTNPNQLCDVEDGNYDLEAFTDLEDLSEWHDLKLTEYALSLIF